MNIKLTVLFEDPFWVGIFEKRDGLSYEVSRVVFGAEPKDYEVYEFILHNFYKLKFSCSIIAEESAEKRVNPKRLKRKVKMETKRQGVGTKAHEAIKFQIQTSKKERKAILKAKNEEEKDRQFELKQKKKKEKHKGH